MNKEKINIQNTLRFIILSLFFLFLTGEANAEIFRWTDERGRVHYTDNPISIPQKNRGFISKKRNQFFSSSKSSFSCSVDSRVNPKKALDDLFERLYQYFQVRFIYQKIPSFTWKLGYKTANSQDFSNLLSYAVLACEEFKKYPQSYILKIKLGSVIFVKNLSIKGQARQSIPDYFKESLVLDFEGIRYDKTYLRHVIHHELYHMIEQEFNDDAYWKDPNWARLNLKNFKYGSGGINARSSNMFLLTHPEKGFVNLYSMSGLEEDKAEVYACLFIRSERQKVMEWTKTDSILRSKVRYMSNFLKQIDYLISQSISS